MAELFHLVSASLSPVFFIHSFKLQPKGPLPVSGNELLLEHSHTHLFYVLSAATLALPRQSSSCARDHMAHRPSGTLRESLPASTQEWQVLFSQHFDGSIPLSSIRAAKSSVVLSFLGGDPLFLWCLCRFPQLGALQEATAAWWPDCINGLDHAPIGSEDSWLFPFLQNSHPLPFKITFIFPVLSFGDSQ